jgi:hypothetical protein
MGAAILAGWRAWFWNKRRPRLVLHAKAFPKEVSHMKSRRIWIVIAGIAALLFLAGAALACSAGGSDDNDGAAARGVPGDASVAGDVDQSAEEPAPDTFASGTGGDDGASAAAPDEQPAPDPALQGLLDRKIAQSTSIDIEVEDIGRDFQELVRLAETAGGFVVSSSFSNRDDEQSADVTIRVPNDRYHEVLAQVRGMGEVSQEGTDATDVTEEYTDVQARLRTLQATEQRYLELLAQAQNINDILLVQDRLDGVRSQIEQLQGRINLLDNLTELATITVHLRPAGAAGGGGGGIRPLETAEAAWEASLDALRGLAAATLAVAAFSWWLLPPLIVAGAAARWWKQRQQPSAS